jgi:hypothetical protein
MKINFSYFINFILVKNTADSKINLKWDYFLQIWCNSTYYFKKHISTSKLLSKPDEPSYEKNYFLVLLTGLLIIRTPNKLIQIYSHKP